MWLTRKFRISFRLDRSNEPSHCRRLMRKVSRAMSNRNLKLVKCSFTPWKYEIFCDSQLCRWQWMRWAAENVMSCHRIMYDHDINHRKMWNIQYTYNISGNAYIFYHKSSSNLAHFQATQKLEETFHAIDKMGKRTHDVRKARLEYEKCQKLVTFCSHPSNFSSLSLQVFTSQQCDIVMNIDWKLLLIFSILSGSSCVCFAGEIEARVCVQNEKDRMRKKMSNGLHLN